MGRSQVGHVNHSKHGLHFSLMFPPIPHTPSTRMEQKADGTQRNLLHLSIRTVKPDKRLWITCMYAYGQCPDAARGVSHHLMHLFMRATPLSALFTAARGKDNRGGCFQPSLTTGRHSGLLFVQELREFPIIK